MQTYTTYVFPGNFRIGRFVGSSLASGPNHIYDRWVVYKSVEDCTAIYDNWSPPAAPWTGHLEIVASQLFYAKPNESGGAIQYSTLNTGASAPAGAIFAFVDQMDCTVSNCTGIARKLYYSCLACPSAGSELPIPASASADGIEFYGAVTEPRLLSGDHGALLSGALTRVPATTVTTADAIPIVTLPQNESAVMRWILRIPPGTAVNKSFCIRSKEQSGIALDGYLQPSGLCIAVGVPNGATN